MKIFPNNFVVSLSRKEEEEGKKRKIPRHDNTVFKGKNFKDFFFNVVKKRKISFSGKLDGDKKRKKHFQTTLFVLFRAFERREWGTVSSSPSFCFFLRDFCSAQWTVAYIDAWLRKMWKRKPGVGDYISRDAACVFHFFLVADFYLKQFSVKRNRGGKILESILS